MNTEEPTKPPQVGQSELTDGLERLLPCPFCGGSVQLELTSESYNKEHGRRKFWGVVCRNTANLGGTCCMEQVPSASKEAAISRWNMRNGVRANATVRRPPIKDDKKHE